MKILKEAIRFSALALLCGVAMLACNPDELEVAPEVETTIDTAVVGILDKISDRLRFLGSTKIQGNAPTAPSASSLKFSLKDTLHLVPGIKMPIEFLHIGASKNVAGVYVQVYNATTGAHFHFDVPEHPEMESDSISVVLVGFENDSTGLGPFGGGVPPANWVGAEDDFEIEITPYDEAGQPIDEVTVPVDVVEPNNDEGSPPAPDPSEFLNESGEFWDWLQTFTYSSNKTFGNSEFDSAPGQIHGGNQIINGCCIEGFSEYGVGIGCEGTPSARTLPFLTFVQFNYESINFRHDGTFSRITSKTTSDPDPWNSNFCDSGSAGVVINEITEVTSMGEWSISKGIAPPNASYLFQHPSDVTILTTRTTSQSKPNGGFGSVGGIIWDVNDNFLMLLKPDNEGGDQHLMIIYERNLPSDEDWYAM